MFRDSQKYARNEIYLSFCGCGFLATYHIGVLACIREHYPGLINRTTRLYGTSAGALISCGIISGVDSKTMLRQYLDLILGSKKHLTGIYSPMYDVSSILREELEKMIPDDICRSASGRVFVNATQFPKLEAALLYDFKTKSELIDAVICSSFIPFVTSWKLRKFRKKIYIDGALSNNQPTEVCNPINNGVEQITISPFIGEGDINPKFFTDQVDYTINLFGARVFLNAFNLLRSVFIVKTPTMEQSVYLALEGYSDAYRYFRTRKDSNTICRSLSSFDEIKSETGSNESCFKSVMEKPGKFAKTCDELLKEYTAAEKEIKILRLYLLKILCIIPFIVTILGRRLHVGLTYVIYFFSTILQTIRRFSRRIRR